MNRIIICFAMVVLCLFVVGFFFYAGCQVGEKNRDVNSLVLSEADYNRFAGMMYAQLLLQDWCLQVGGQWLPTDKKQTYIPITREQAGQLLQQGVNPIKDANGNYYADVIVFNRSCVVLRG